MGCSPPSLSLSLSLSLGRLFLFKGDGCQLYVEVSSVVGWWVWCGVCRSFYGGALSLSLSLLVVLFKGDSCRLCVEVSGVVCVEVFGTVMCFILVFLVKMCF